MKISRAFLIFGMAAMLIIALPACKQLSDLYTNLQRLEFKLKDVDNFTMSGINLSSKKSITSFSVTDGLKLTSDFNAGRLPVVFILNVEARNPNDGSGKSTSTTATLTSFDWNLYIDGVKTISGDIASPIKVPGTGSSTIIPLRMSLDLLDFFKGRGYEKILNLALAIGGVNGSTSQLKLDARPTVSTPFGPINYPGRITIVDTKFN